MTHPVPADCEVRIMMPATFDALEQFLDEWFQRNPRLPDWARGFRTELLLRESVTNAIVHGCRTDAARHVRCAWRLRGRSLLIVVEDDGEGFNWRTAGAHDAGFSHCSGRGIAIMRKYANRVRYNERGNAVAMLKRF